MSNLYNLARSGLAAAQAGINTTGHNVANANTPGFSRQQVLVSSAGAQGGPNGYSGMGVQVQTVRRIYDGFLTNQLNQSTAAGSALSTYSAQIDRVNNLLADRTVGVSPAISKFYDGVSAVASNPADPAARQEMIGRANSLVSQLSTANQFLADQQQSINQQIDTTVNQINSFAQRISNLNAAIVDARASVGGGQVPNDLLDQRDQLITGLNELVSVTVIADGDAVNLSVGNGQTLLSGTRVFPLDAVQSAADPARTALAYTAADGTIVELSDQSVSGGALGGLLQFRRESLDTAQNELGRIAVGMAISFNQQHVQGMDAAGNKALSFTATTGTATGLSGTVTDVSAFENADSSYDIEFDSANKSFTVNGQPATLSQTGTPTRQTLAFDGIELDVTAYMAGNATTDGAFTVETRQMSFYSVKNPVPIANEDNRPDGPAVSFQYTDIGKLTTSDYQVQFKDGAYLVTKQPEGTGVTPTQTTGPNGQTTLAFDGIELTVTPSLDANNNVIPPGEGDSWMVQPTRNGARDIKVAITDPSAIAAADLQGGSANGRNALALANLQTKSVLANGSMSVTGAYSQMVNGIGVKTQAIQTASKAQDSLTAQSFAAQQAVSGVNLNEEYINLDYYVQHYNASARLIDVASTMFDTLLGLRA